MKVVFTLIAVTLLPFFSTAQYWQQRVDYTIDVKLLEKEKSLEGFARIVYTNHSPDTLHYIWFHLWPNAYKNDGTAFSEQLLRNGNTSFYFSDEDQRGYINRLDFSVNNKRAAFTSDSAYIDKGKLSLPSPLAPGDSISITTPFFVKLPAFFSRSGYTQDLFVAAQWYPKPAVYDSRGWHPIPYLDQGEFYSEFGNFTVNISVPDDYLVASSGNLQTEKELNFLKTTGKIPAEKQTIYLDYLKKKKTTRSLNSPSKTKNKPSETKSTGKPFAYKTLTYSLQNAHDFAWFASKNFIVSYDSLQTGGRTIDVFAFYHPKMQKDWQPAVGYLKTAVRFYSGNLMAYPYSSVTAVGTESLTSYGGMEYPSITLITGKFSGKLLDEVLTHETGHNWFYGIAASNERAHAWMDEGMNSFYEQRYMQEKYGHNYTTGEYPKFLRNKLPASQAELGLRSKAHVYKDQPIETPSADFEALNYGLVVYEKGSQWMTHLEKMMGREAFDSMMRLYFNEWKFKHPYPEDFRLVVERFSKQEVSAVFDKLHRTGMIDSVDRKRQLKPTFLFNLKETDKYQYISFLPAIGYNYYDDIMLGAGVHNYQLPMPRLRFAFAGLYGTKSQAMNFIGSADYDLFLQSNGLFKKITLGLNAARFSRNAGTDSLGQNVFTSFTKWVPKLQLHFKQPVTSSIRKWIDLRSYQITETAFEYVYSSGHQSYFPTNGGSNPRYLNQISFHSENSRALYPWNYELRLQQGNKFYKLAFEGNYFFNYRKGGGLSVRTYAAKFGYLGNPSIIEKYQLVAYMPKLTATRGDEDYTYSNYFIGRNELEGSGLSSQQIALNEGGLKLRTDLFQGLQGRSENWIAAANFSTSIPKKVFPLPIPLKIFLDVGTYAEAWKKDAATSRFLYVAGLELPLFNVVTVYAPVLYSKEFNSITTTGEYDSFFKRISFTIRLDKLKPKMLTTHFL